MIVMWSQDESEPQGASWNAVMQHSRLMEGTHSALTKEANATVPGQKAKIVGEFSVTALVDELQMRQYKNRQDLAKVAGSKVTGSTMFACAAPPVEHPRHP